MVFVPFYAYHIVHTEAKFVHCLLNDEEKQKWLSVCKGMEDKAKRTEIFFVRYPVSKDENTVNL